jgi:hypothetical protein
MNIQEISAKVRISVGSACDIVCQHMIPKMLSPEHKETQTSLAGGLITVADQGVDV